MALPILHRMPLISSGHADVLDTYHFTLGLRGLQLKKMSFVNILVCFCRVPST